ncbi:MAG TPA: dihydrodipicolinate synthase family protein, partial [Aggregatilineales bacterium]|nr:dihydrodipicolinate synthase family protein [Aggregatilineales bacterium]
MTGQFSGVFNILATPFTADWAVDSESLRRLIEFQLDKGAHGLTILGVLGEAAKLTVEERNQVVQTVIATVAGRVPVIVGTSHQETAVCIGLSKVALEAGAAGVMIAPPFFEKVTDANVVAFYEQIASSIRGTIVVQDYPPVTNVIFSAPLLAALADRIPIIRHLKLEDPPLMQKISAVRALTDHYAIFGGLGG